MFYPTGWTEKKQKLMKNKRFNIYNFGCIAELALSPRNNVPILRATHSVPEKIIPFNAALSSEEGKADSYVHFFIDDYQFDRVWRSPERYVSALSKYQGIISPDFSLFIEMPIAVQRWNVYRNRVLAAYYAQAGIDAIPCAGWSDERSYGFCFEGLPKHSTIAISTNGCLSSKESLYYFEKGFNRMLEALSPSVVLNYGRPVKPLFDNCKIPVIIYDSYSQTMKRKLRRGTNGRQGRDDGQRLCIV